METLETKKNANNFYCRKCDFSCSKKSNWEKHIMTRKHKMDINGNFGNEKKCQNYICETCSKEFKTKSGLWKHIKGVKKCQKMPKNAASIQDENTNFIDKDLIVNMITHNQEFMREMMSKMMDIMPQIGNTTNNTITNTNSNNTNHFNIQMFLNEHCKNAMNLTDFIESLPITAETYDNTLENGLTKSMTYLITNGLSQLDVLERPIHCTDTARKTLYIKDNNSWEKDNELLTLIEGIQKIIFKQRTMLKKWQNANEGWDTNELLQEKMTRLVFHSMSDIGNDEKEMGKIIRAISKNVYLDNNTKLKYL